MKKKSDTKSDTLNERKRKKQEKKKEQKEKETAEELYQKHVAPIIDFDEDLSVGIMEDGTLVDMFEIITKDINSTAIDELELDKHLWDKLYKTYSEDLKIVGFYFLPDTSKQQEYMDGLLQRTSSPVLRKLNREKKEELAFVSSSDEYIEMQFFLWFYSRNKSEFRENSINIYSMLNRGFMPLIENMSAEKKKSVLFKLNNKNLEGGR